MTRKIARLLDKSLVYDHFPQMVGNLRAVAAFAVAANAQRAKLTVGLLDFVSPLGKRRA